MNIIFDLDGTIFDSRPGIVLSYLAALRALGHTPTANINFDSLIGPEVKGVMQYLLSLYGDDRVELGVQEHWRHYGDIGIYACNLYPDMEKLLRNLYSAQHRLFIATVKRDNLARKLVREMGLDCLFVETYGSLDSGKYENKSELISHVVSSNRLIPSATIVIGDRQHDIVGAHNNHLNAIGVLWGYGARPELEESKAEYIVQYPREIAEILESHKVAEHA